MQHKILDLLPKDLSAVVIVDQPEGCSHTAWHRTDALRVIEWLKGRPIAVLGGDVLIKNGKEYQHNYDNWYSDKQPNESNEAYIQKSHEKAEQYIRQYPHSDKEQELLFVLVLNI